MSESKIISIASRKGGVGKSTTARNLGYYLAEQGYHVLIVDTDSQGNLSTGFGEQKTATTAGTLAEPMWAVMQDEPAPSNESFIKHSGKLSYTPCNESLAALELQMVGIIQREYILVNSLESIKSAYDFILLDTGPSLGLMTVNALVASDSVLIVSSPEEDSNTGAELLVKSIQHVRRNLNKSLTVEGILMNMVVERSTLSRDMMQRAQDTFGEVINIYDTKIPRTLQIGKAKAEQKSIFEIRNSNSKNCYTKCKASIAFENFGREFLLNGGYSNE